MLFELQNRLGNKWREISSHFQDKSEVVVKNYFYSTLRRSVRALNQFIKNQRDKIYINRLRSFNENCICKIIAKEQGKG